MTTCERCDKQADEAPLCVSCLLLEERYPRVDERVRMFPNIETA